MAGRESILRQASEATLLAVLALIVVGWSALAVGMIVEGTPDQRGAGMVMLTPVALAAVLLGFDPLRRAMRGF